MPPFCVTPSWLSLLLPIVSIVLCFYTRRVLLSLFQVFFVVFTSRDFASMRHAENRARTTGKLYKNGSNLLAQQDNLDSLEGVPHRSINVILPLLVLIVVSLVGIWWNEGRLHAKSFNRCNSSC